MLSIFSVTSEKQVSAVEAKLTSLIGINFSNTGLQFRIIEDETFRSIISAARNVSRD